MNHLRENWGSTYIVEKIVENRLRWSEQVEKRLVYVVVNQMNESYIKSGRGNSVKTIRETIIKDLSVSELDSNMIYETTILRNLIYVADST